MASKKATGSTKNSKGSNPQYRGVKKFGGEFIQAGGIIVRQTGNDFYAGEFVGTGKDYTLFAKKTGYVTFKKGWKNRTFVTISENNNNIIN